MEFALGHMAHLEDVAYPRAAGAVLVQSVPTESTAQMVVPGGGYELAVHLCPGLQRYILQRVDGVHYMVEIL